MASEGRKINQLLFFIFDKVIKTRSSAPRAAEGSVCGQPFPRGGGTARRGPEGLLRGREGLASHPLERARPPPWSSRPPSRLFPLGRKQGSLQAQGSHLEGG